MIGFVAYILPLFSINSIYSIQFFKTVSYGTTFMWLKKNIETNV
jgi:hypothetical protein